jgi:hypothetical protein
VVVCSWLAIVLVFRRISRGRRSAPSPGTGDPGVAVLLELVPQRPDRDAEDGRGVGAVAERVLQGVDDQVALDLGEAAADGRRGALASRRGSPPPAASPGRRGRCRRR